jgi:hypothetical protein
MRLIWGKKKHLYTYYNLGHMGHVFFLFFQIERRKKNKNIVYIYNKTRLYITQVTHMVLHILLVVVE